MICRRSDNESYESSDTKDLDVDFEKPVNQVEEEEGDDWGFPSDLKRIVEREERKIKSHQEETEVVNLGTSEEKKEVKIDTCVSTNI